MRITKVTSRTHMLGRSSRTAQHIFNLLIAFNSMIFAVSVCTFVKLEEWFARVVILPLLAIGSTAKLAAESCTLTFTYKLMRGGDTISLDLRSENLAEGIPLVKISAT